MIPSRIRVEIENSPLIANAIGSSQTIREWGDFTRTVFEKIAKKINQQITLKVIEDPALATDFQLFGKDEFRNILSGYRLMDMNGFIELLKQMSAQRPFTWISGKTLQAYWNNGNAKDKKLNVLLTFLGIAPQDWDEWKNADNLNLNTAPKDNENNTLRLLKKHFVGHYYRYYQKTDNSPVMVKTPFIIREDLEHLVVAETKTLGHSYKSKYMVIRNGALYIECENLEWNEKETYIFNIGFETNPKVLTGVSNTLNKKGQAIAIKNVLVKLNHAYDYHEMEGMEIPFDEPLDPSHTDARVIRFFMNSRHNVIHTHYCHTLEELSPEELRETPRRLSNVMGQT